MTTFIGDDERMQWRIQVLHWKRRLAALAFRMNGDCHLHGFIATADEKFVHLHIPPKGATGALLVTLPIDPPYDPDWELFAQLIAVEDSFNFKQEYTYPPLHNH